MKKLFILIVVLAFIALNSHAQIGIKTETPDPSAELDIVSISADKGLLIPRVTLSANLNDPSPVTNPAVGLLVFNIGPNQEQGFYYWEADGWHRFIEQSPSGGVFFQSAIQCYNIATDATGDTNQVYIRWQGADYEDNMVFTHSNTDSPHLIFVNVAGVYEISYAISVSIGGSNNSIAFQSRIKVNGSVIQRGKSYESGKNSSTKYTMSPAPILWTLQPGNSIGITFNIQPGTSNAFLTTISRECALSVKLIKSF
jgi:hypothetical protein